MWKDIKGYEDYYIVSDNGEVWSKDRTCIDSLGRKRFRKGVKLNPDIASNGYYRVTLARDGFKPTEVSKCANHGGTHYGFVFELV